MYYFLVSQPLCMHPSGLPFVFILPVLSECQLSGGKHIFLAMFSYASALFEVPQLHFQFKFLVRLVSMWHIKASPISFVYRLSLHDATRPLKLNFFFLQSHFKLSILGVLLLAACRTKQFEDVTFLMVNDMLGYFIQKCLCSGNI